MTESSLGAGAWIALTLAWAAALSAPGPDVFLLMRVAVRERRAAVFAALGIMTGNTLWIMASVLGLTSLFASVPQLTPILQAVGSCILGWIGVQSIRAGLRAMCVTRTEQAIHAPRRPYLLGFVTNISNPKALIFFTALLTQFLPPALPGQDRLLVIIMMVGIGLVWFVGVALACSVARFREWFGRFAPWLDVIAGAVFLVVGLAVIAELFLGETPVA